MHCNDNYPSILIEEGEQKKLLEYVKADQPISPDTVRKEKKKKTIH
jgi:hypothetical protein